MRNPRMLLLAAGSWLGCGDDDSAAPDAFDAPDEVSAEVNADDGGTNDEATGPDDPGMPDDTTMPDDATPEAVDAPSDDDAASDGAGTCGPSWHPTACADCLGSRTGNTCNQDCRRCEDGHEYFAECDGTTHTCRCLLDRVEVCTCTSANPVGDMGCEPEEWGGANCCWTVG